MYFAFVIKGINTDNFGSFKDQFIYHDKLNILEDQGVSAKIFHRKIQNSKDEEEQFETEFPTACFIFNHVDKLQEQHANAFVVRQHCYQKYGLVKRDVYEQGEVDCRFPGFVGFKGQKLAYLNVGQVDKSIKGATYQPYAPNQAITIVNLNALS